MLASLIVVALGGSIGAIARFLVVMLAQNVWGLRFPYGTLLVNTTGSFLAGFLIVLIMQRAMGSEMLRLFLMVGFLGAYTTFSTYSLETLMLYQEGEFLKAGLNIITNNILSLGFVFLGIVVARSLKAF